LETQKSRALVADPVMSEIEESVLLCWKRASLPGDVGCGVLELPPAFTKKNVPGSSATASRPPPSVASDCLRSDERRYVALIRQDAALKVL
jgi:hypothetical protein